MRSGPWAAQASNSTPSTNIDPPIIMITPNSINISRTGRPLVLFFSSALLICACNSDKSSEQTASATTDPHTVSLTNEQLANAGIVTGKAERRSLGALLPVQGVVDVPPQNMVSVSAPLGGYLRSTDLLPGMEIQKGQTLALMEDPHFIQLQQEYLVTKGKVELLTQDHERQKALNDSKTASDKVLQEVTTELSAQTVVMRSLAEQLRLIGVDPATLTAENLSRTVALRSPIHGWVAKVNVNIGRYVQPTDVLFELVDPKDIHLALTLFEKDLPLVRVGQEVHARPTAHPQDEYEAEVILVGRSLDTDRSTVVHCHFTKSPRDLVPGMAMSATLESHTDTVWCVPEGAIVLSANGPGVFAANADGTYTLIDVETGTHEYGFVELLSPAPDLTGRSMVVVGSYTLLAALMNTGE